MFSYHSIPAAKAIPNLPIVQMPVFSREKIILQLAVHSYGLEGQMQALVSVMARCGLVAGRHFVIIQPDRKTLKNTLTTSQQHLFAIHFLGAGQVLHALLSNFQNVINIAIEVRDPSSADNIICRDTSDFPKLIHNLLLRYNDNEPLIPAELHYVHQAHRTEFVALLTELNKFHEGVQSATSHAKNGLISAVNALVNMGEDADNHLESVASSRYVALVAALCRACRQAADERPGLFDRATKQAKLGEKYFELLEKYAAKIPSDLNPLAKYSNWMDITSNEEKVKKMDDVRLNAVYEKIVAPNLRQAVSSVARVGNH